MSWSCRCSPPNPGSGPAPPTGYGPCVPWPPRYRGPGRQRTPPTTRTPNLPPPIPGPQRPALFPVGSMSTRPRAAGPVLAPVPDRPCLLRARPRPDNHRARHARWVDLETAPRSRDRLLRHLRAHPPSARKVCPVPPAPARQARPRGRNRAFRSRYPKGRGLYRLPGLRPTVPLTWEPSLMHRPPSLSLDRHRRRAPRRTRKANAPVSPC